MKIEELIQQNSAVVSVARTGSSVLPWINNPHDTDYIIYVKDRHELKYLRKQCKDIPNNECWIFSTIEGAKMQLYAYQYRFLQTIYGTDVPTYDLLEHVADYKRLLVTYGLKHKSPITSKQWYHILTGIYMIQNGSYELTDEQKHNIQMCHDKRMTPELFEWIQEQLQQFKIDVENK